MTYLITFRSPKTVRRTTLIFLEFRVVARRPICRVTLHFLRYGILIKHFRPHPFIENPGRKVGQKVPKIVYLLK